MQLLSAKQTAITHRQDFAILSPGLPASTPSYSQLVLSLISQIISNDSKRIFILSLPSTHDHATVIQLFLELSRALQCGVDLKADLTKAFSKKKSKAVTAVKSARELVLDGLKKLVREMQTADLGETFRADIRLANVAVVLGKF